MSVVTFWSSSKEQTGQTLSIAAIATYMAIEHNYRILIISTAYNDNNLANCFWQPKKTKKNLGLFGPNTSIELEDGISGLTKIMKSNKLAPETIANYTKIVFKEERLEILQSFKGASNDYADVKKVYPEIIKLASNYYDLVFVDLDRKIEDDIVEPILKGSNLVMVNLSQRLSCINDFIEMKEKRNILEKNKSLILINRYDKFSKYNIKNISRYMREKNKVLTIPYNTLFFEACEEASVPDLFLRFRRVEEDDRNGFFLAEVKRATENIMYRLQSLQIK